MTGHLALVCDNTVRMKTTPETLTATEFKAKCLRILENLGPEGLTVTKRGRPIARVTPVSAADHGKFYGSLKGKIKIKGDLFSTGVKWNAQS
jgi:prevent-host-death family protein